MRRLGALEPAGLMAVAVALALIWSALSATGARAEGWRSAQPPPPPPPPGQAGVEAPLPLGHIGQISFWAPNHGLLITAGNEAIPAGLYFYNGVAWRELSTVCGGSDGRIAWAGPDDFWTIADQQTGEQHDSSLCHFQNGRVVASYAEPVGLPDSYQPMDAAACAGPDDCWFGGGVLPSGANSGAFHLHWSGSALTPVPALETPEPQLQDPARPVAAIVAYKGRFYESVQIRPGDLPAPGESAEEPFVLHRIAEGSSNLFAPLLVEGPPGESFDYGGGTPAQLAAFRFSADANELWAVAGPHESSSHIVALRLNASNQFEQVALDEASVRLAGEGVNGAAAEPGGQAAWISLYAGGSSTSGPARLARIHADGQVDPVVTLPEAGEPIAAKGSAEAIACPAQGDCWVATGQGWLFHLGGDYPEDDDPAFQSLITYRPQDASLTFEAPEGFTEDDSGANPAALPPPPAPSAAAELPSEVPEPLFSRVKSQLLRHTTLALSFTLATRSRVRLVALRKHKTVAATRRQVLSGGRHTLRLALSTRSWPTKLDLQVQALGPVPLVQAGAGEGGGGGPTGGPTTVGTIMSAPPSFAGDRGLSAPLP